MKKHMIVVGISSIFFLFAENNPFSLSKHLAQLDKEKMELLDTLAESKNNLDGLSSEKNTVNIEATLLPLKKLFIPEKKRLEVSQKRISKEKKIRKEREKALKIKKHKEALLREKQQKERARKKKKSINAKMNKAPIKQKRSNIVQKEVDKKRQNNLAIPKVSTVKVKESIEQEYLEAIRAVNQ